MRQENHKKINTIKKLLEILNVNGKKHGVEKLYFENGELASEIPYVEGKMHGVAKYYFEDGNLEEEILYENGIEKNKDKIL